MNYYIDIEFQPDAEMGINVLLNKAYTKLHKTLYELKSNDIGVSFPQYRLTLGNVLRLHGSRERLYEIQGLNWLGGLSGYCNFSEISPAPEQVSYRTISRRQSNLSEAKLRRLQKRSTIRSPEDIQEYRKKMFSKGMDNPYVELESASTGRKYRRYFKFGALKNVSVSGEFDFFGLSKKATIPWF